MVAWVKQKIQTGLGLVLFVIILGVMCGIGYWVLSNVETVIAILKDILGFLLFVLGKGWNAGRALCNGIAGIFH